MRQPVSWFLAPVLALLCLVTPARAADNDPLRFVPDVADFVVKVEQPRQLVEMFLELIPAKELQGFKGYREFYESTNYRRFLQLVGHFERELGKPWPELLDQLAGNGACLALKIDKDPPALVVVEGKSPELTQRFVALLAKIIEQELARQESKDRIERRKYHGTEIIKLGDAHLTAVGSTLVFSNKAKGLEAALDLHRDKAKKSVLTKQQHQDARQLIGDGALAWAWVSTAPAKMSADFKNVYELPSSFFPIPLLFGGLADSLRRSDFATAALRRVGKDPVLSIRMPAGKEGLHEALAGHAPVDDGLGLRPLLEPKGVLVSMTYYHDLAKFWKKREQILPKDQLADIEKAEKNSGFVLFGVRFGDIIGCFGARHRLVAVRQEKTAYSTEPQNRIPAFAWVVEARDPEKFIKSIEPPIRSINLVTGAFVRMDPIEEMHGSHKIIGYRFAEQQRAGKIDTAYNGVLPNFSPCFVRVGDQVIFSSTIELAHTLLGELEKESKDPPSVAKHATVRGQFYWEGLSSFLASNQEALTTQSILAEGSTPDEARQQVALLLQLLNKLGRVELGVEMEAKQYRLDLRARVGK